MADEPSARTISGGVRVARPEEYAEVLAFVLREQPHLESGELAPALFDDGFAPRRSVLVAHDAGELVGCGLLVHYAFQPEDRNFLRVVVAGSHRGRGLGRSLLSALEVPDAVRSLRTFTYDDDQRSVDIAEHWGYARLQRSISSRLDLAETSAPLLPAGITLDARPGFDFPDPEAVEAMLDASQTNPERNNSGAFTLERLQHLNAEGETPVLMLLRVQERPAALAFGATVGEMAYVAYTGVDPAFRGRGLARLAKQALHAEAFRLGARVCFTENEEHNAGIRRINAELGYQPLFGVWRHERRR